MYRLCSNSQCSEAQLPLGQLRCPGCNEPTDVEFVPGDVLKIDPQRKATVLAKLSRQADAGMSAVYLVERQRSDGAPARGVLKVAKARSVRALEREVKHLQTLKHPNIIRLLYGGDKHNPREAIWQDDQDQQPLFFVALEYMDGGSLKDELERTKEAPLARAGQIVTEISKALDYAHEQGVVHLDIKPANILFGQDGRIVLSDFGVARDRETLSKERNRSGTPVYNAPEQLKADTVLDRRVDIYALGLVLYEMLVGQNPVQLSSSSGGVSTRDRKIKQLIESLPPPRSLKPNLPAVVEQVIVKATHPDRDQRFASAGELAQALTEALETHRNKTKLYRLGTGVAALAVILLLLLASMGAGAFWLRTRNTPTPVATAVVQEPAPVEDDETDVVLGPTMTLNPTAPPPTPTATPTVRQRAGSTITRLPTPNPTSTLAPVVRPAATVGPIRPDFLQIELISPAAGVTVNSREVEFRWRYGEASGCPALPDGHFFEIRLWPEASPEQPGAMDARQEQTNIACDGSTGVHRYVLGDVRQAIGVSRNPAAERFFWDVAIIRVTPGYTAVVSSQPRAITILR